MNTIGSLIGGVYGARRRLAQAFAPEPIEANESARILEEDGVVILPSLLPAKLIDGINQANAGYYDLSRPEELLYSPDLVEVREAAGATPDELRRFYGLHIKNYQEKFDVYRHVVPRIDPIMRSYYRSRFYVRDVYCYRTQPVPTVSGSYRWHTDNYPIGSSRAIVYLNDVDSVENGPLAVALGSHAGYRPELGRIGARFEESYVRDNFKILPCLGKKGTVILFNNNSIHRATDPARGHRDVINFIMFPALFPRLGRGPTGADLRTEDNWLKKYTR